MACFFLAFTNLGLTCFTNDDVALIRITQLQEGAESGRKRKKASKRLS
jgi:hypothetical protein